MTGFGCARVADDVDGSDGRARAGSPLGSYLAPTRDHPVAEVWADRDFARESLNAGTGDIDSDTIARPKSPSGTARAGHDRATEDWLADRRPRRALPAISRDALDRADQLKVDGVSQFDVS